MLARLKNYFVNDTFTLLSSIDLRSTSFDGLLSLRFT